MVRYRHGYIYIYIYIYIYSQTELSAVTWRTAHEQQTSLSRHSTDSGDCKRKIYENTGSVCKRSEMLKDDISNVFKFQ